MRKHPYADVSAGAAAIVAEVGGAVEALPKAGVRCRMEVLVEKP